MMNTALSISHIPQPSAPFLQSPNNNITGPVFFYFQFGAFFSCLCVLHVYGEVQGFKLIVLKPKPTCIKPSVNETW